MIRMLVICGLGLVVAGSAASAQPAGCVGGVASGFACDKIDLLGHMPLNDFSSAPDGAMDTWGFRDFNTDREYALIGLSNGTAVVDLTDANELREIGTITGDSTFWRDIKILQFYDQNDQRWQTYAYVTADGATDKLVVIDLTQLPHSISLVGNLTAETNAHNVYISGVDWSTNTALAGESPILMTGGSNLDGGQFRAYDLNTPDNPAFIRAAPLAGNVHDLASTFVTGAHAQQCPNATLTSTGLDYCMLLGDFNEGEFVIWDITDINEPRLLSSNTYAGVGHVHSGWFTDDGQYLVTQDELDEVNSNSNTIVRVFDISNLATPALIDVWVGPTGAIDHNGFVRGNRVYLSNYTRGLTVLDITDPINTKQIGRFDTLPVDDGLAFDGAWGVYPFLPSGRLIVSDISNGLFVLRDNTNTSSNGVLEFSAESFGDEEGNIAQFSIQRNGGSTGAVSVEFMLIPGSAGETDTQFTGRGLIAWADGETMTKNFGPLLTVDALDEEPEQYFVRLFNPTGGAVIGKGFTNMFISDVGKIPEVNTFEPTILISELDQLAVVTIKRGGSATGALSVDYATLDGTALAGSDYESESGTLNWADGDATPRTINIHIEEDSDVENDETFSLELSNAIGGNVGNAAITSITISDSTQAAPPPPPAPAPTPTPTPTGSSGGGGAPNPLVLLALFAALFARGVSADEADDKGFEIAARADRVDRGFNDSVVDLRMVLRNKAGKEITRELNISTLEIPDEDVGDKSLIVFYEPPDIEGTALLSHAKIIDADDQWLYLPALKRVKRISSTNKSGPFVGSEFAFEDFTSLELNKYTYKYLNEEPCGDMTCDVVERYPRYENSGYTRQITWIDQDVYQVRRVDYYDRRDALLKTLELLEYRQYQDSYYRSHLLRMKNHRTGKETDLIYSDYEFKTGLSDKDFVKSVLSRLR